jgi:hypothetical protein
VNKVRIFRDCNLAQLEMKINDFLSNEINVINIKTDIYDFEFVVTLLYKRVD